MSIQSMYDVAVVGGGPAGAATALHLAKGGASVILLEKRRLPRYKPCGGGVSRKAYFLLPDKPTEVIEDATKEVVFLYRSADPLPVILQEPVMFMVMRDRFDHWLLQRAEQAGVAVHPSTEASALELTDNGVMLTAGPAKIAAKVVVAADGAHGKTAKALGLRLPFHRGLALESELPVAVAQVPAYHGRAYINYGSLRYGYTWLFPKAAHLSVGSGSFHPNAKRLWAVLLAFCRSQGLEPPDRNRLKAYPLPILAKLPTAWHTERGLVVGDAGGLIDPFCGEGIYYALKSGIWAAEAILKNLKGEKDALAEYTQRLRQDLWPELEAAARLGKIIYGFPSLVHTLLRNYPGAAAKLVSVIFGSITYRELYHYLRQRFPLFH